MDFFAWINDQLSEFEEVRADIPFFGSNDEIANAETLLKLRFQDFLSQPDLLKQFVNSTNPHKKLFSVSSIPFLLDGKWNEDQIFCINSKREPIVQHNGETIVLEMNGMKYTLAAVSKPLIDHFIQHREAPFDAVKNYCLQKRKNSLPFFQSSFLME